MTSRSRISASKRTEKAGAIRSCRFPCRFYLVECTAGLAQELRWIRRPSSFKRQRPGPSQLRGRAVLALTCSRPPGKNDQAPAAMGLLHESKRRQVGVPDRPELRPPARTCWPASKSTFKGEVKGEEYTVVAQASSTSSAELSKARRLEGGIDLRVLSRPAARRAVSQSICAGRHQATDFRSTRHSTVDELVAAVAAGQCARHSPARSNGVNDLPNDENKRFRCRL